MTDRNPLSYTGNVSGSLLRQGDVKFNAEQFTVNQGLVSLLDVSMPIESVITDSGTATPNVSGEVNLVGDTTGVDTTATGNSITLNFDITEQPTIPTSVVTDSGTATTATNSFSIVGDGSGVVTSGSSDTVTVGFDVTEQPAIPISVTCDSGSATPSANTLIINSGDNLNVVATAAKVTLSINNGSTTQAGVVEYSTSSEIESGSSTTLAIAPAQLVVARNRVQVAEVTLTSAQVKALRATPITIVSAPGGGRIALFMGAILKLNYGGSNVFTEAGDNLAIRYKNSSGTIVSQTIETTGFIDQSVDTINNGIPLINGIADLSSSSSNSPLILHNIGGSEIAGNAANDNTLTVRVYYTSQTI